MGWHPVFCTMKLPLGMDLSSSAVSRGRSIICRLWLGSFFPRLTEPESTVRLPRAFEKVSAASLLGAKPPQITSWQLSIRMDAPSLP